MGMAMKVCSSFFFLFLSSSAMAATSIVGTYCDTCYHHSKAAYFPKTSALSSGACGYGSLALNYYGGHLAAVSPAFFMDGKYCGTCFQVKCKNKSLCSDNGTTVVVTDLKKDQDNSTDLVLSSGAFRAMANSGMDTKLMKLGRVDVDFKRIPCEYKKNLALRVEESSKYPNNLAFTVLYQGGLTEIQMTELFKDNGSGSWTSSTWMDRSHGAVWNTTVAPTGPLMARFVVYQGYDLMSVYARKALPAQWKPGTSYETDAKIDVINFAGCCEPK